MQTDNPQLIDFEPIVLNFFSRNHIAGPLDYLQHCIPAGARLLVAGGAIRNLLIQTIHGSAPETRDIDLFIVDLHPDVSLECALDGQQRDLTELCGVRWLPESSTLAFDICRLSDFVIINKYKLAPSLENLLHTLDFTINAVVFDVGARKLYENGCLAAIRDRQLDFNTTYKMNKRLLAYRILLIRFKTDFILADRVFNFLKYRLDIDAIRHLRGLLVNKQGREMGRAIMDDYNRICSYADHRTYLLKSSEYT
ncbi:MAG: hypothetical protein GY697_00555 [Desulfobacterales bacterium]|nr:hypothetical protein [Desulfobacterales bacterium]